MKSLSARLTLWLLAASLPLVLLVEGGLYLWLSSSMISQFDQTLQARTDSLVNAAKFDRGAIEFDVDASVMPQFDVARNDGADEYFQLWRLDQGRPEKEVHRSGTLAGASMTPVIPSSRQTLDEGVIRDTIPVRLVAVRFIPHPDPEAANEEYREKPTVPAPELLLMVAKDRRQLDRTIEEVGIALLASGAALCLGLVVITSMALRRGLRPVRDLASQISSIDPTRPQVPLTTAALPTELAPIALRTSELLHRVRDAIAREKRFSAGAAHQLRTPIAEVRAISELALSRERSPEAYQSALADVLSTAQTMEMSVNALLKLARIESGREQARLEPVDVSGLIQEAWARWVAPGVQRSLKLRLQAPEGCEARADRAMLATALDNLLANAAEYTPDTGSISCTLARADGGSVTCTIANTRSGTQVRSAPDPSPGVFMHSDHRHRAHLGVGLPLSEALIATCAGTMTVTPTESEFVVQITLGASGSPSLAAPEQRAMLLEADRAR